MKALVIPAERLSDALLELIGSLPPGEFAAIVVVDDGSRGLDNIAVELRARGIAVVRHAVRTGRGAAIRAGMHRALAEAPALDCIVLADESNSAGDIARLGGATPDAVILATRAGAGLDRTTRALTGIRVSDPWATLRSVPASLIPHLLTLQSPGPEFDVETLAIAAEHGIPIVERRIEPKAPARSTLRPLLWFLATVRPARAITRLLAGFCLAVFAAVIATTVYGFATGDLFRQFIWLPWGLHRLVHFGALFAGWSFPILLIVPWTYAAVFAALIAGATTLAAGPQAVAAVLFFVLSANALGAAGARRMRKPNNGTQATSEIVNTLLGIGIYALLMTLTARTPVNYPVLWFAMLALPIALNLRGVARRIRAWLAALRSVERPNWRERGAFALLLFVLCIQWLAALQPESSADGLTMHLAVPADIAAHHAMTFSPGVFVWSVMPMAADFTYSIVYLLGGEASASLLNFALLLAIVGLLYGAARQWLPRETALVIAALFASTPLVNLVTGSLFIENFVAAMVLAAALELWHFHETGAPRALWVAAVLAGTAASAKLGACVFVLMVLAIAGIEARRRRALRPAVVAAALLLLFAAPAYVIAYAKTGDPVFPFLNTRFPSPLLEHGIEFRNNFFTQPLTWKTPFELTFHTRDYIEGLNGAIGFEYLLLIPFAAIALFAARNYGARIAAAIALFAGAMVMASQPYARYIYPAMPLLFIPSAALAARFAARQRRLYFALCAAAILSIALNVYFTPASGWYHKDLYSPAIFRSGGRARVIREGVPLRDVTIRFRKAHPQDHVMLLVEHDLADAGSSAYEYHWHQHGVWKRIVDAKSVTALRNLFSILGVRYFISRRPGPDDDLLSPWSFAEFLSNCTADIIRNGRFYAAEITPECESLGDAALEARLATLPSALVSPGIYDDFDAALSFHGAWTRSKAFAGPYRHSVSYTDSPGATAAFAFEGTSLTYIFTRTFNRGIADLEIDGVPHEIDLYSPVTQWQSRLEFCCLAAGRHLAVLRVTGRKRPDSQGAYVDLDAFLAR